MEVLIPILKLLLHHAILHLQSIAHVPNFPPRPNLHRPRRRHHHPRRHRLQR